MVGLGISELIGGLFFFYLYIRLTRSPETLGIGVISLYISYISLRNFFEFLPRLFILFSLLFIAVLGWRISQTFDKKRKEIKHLLPSLKQRVIIMSKFLVPAIILSHLTYFSFHSLVLTLFVLMVGYIGAEFLLYQNFPLAGQELYFRPKGKKAIYFRFVECIVFSVILVIGYWMVCEKLGINY